MVFFFRIEKNGTAQNLRFLRRIVFAGGDIGISHVIRYICQITDRSVTGRIQERIRFDLNAFF